MTTMLLKNLIDNLNSKISNLKIRKISADSRKIQKGDLFVSIKGNKFDGNKFIDHAILNGAKVVVYSGLLKKKYKNITYIKTKILERNSQKFHQNTSKKNQKILLLLQAQMARHQYQIFFTKFLH